MPRAITAVGSSVEQEVHRPVRQPEIYLAAGCPSQPQFEPLDLNCDHLAQVRWQERMKHENFIEPVDKFRRKPLSRRIYGDRGQVFLAAADCDELGIARSRAARHNRLQRRSKNSKGRRILKDQSPEHQPFDNREVGGGILWD